MAPLTIEDDKYKKRDPYEQYGDFGVQPGGLNPPGSDGSTPKPLGFEDKYGANNVFDVDESKYGGNTNVITTGSFAASGSGQGTTVDPNNGPMSMNGSVFALDPNSPIDGASGPVAVQGAPMVTPGALTQPGGTDGSDPQGGATGDNGNGERFNLWELQGGEGLVPLATTEGVTIDDLIKLDLSGTGETTGAGTLSVGDGAVNGDTPGVDGDNGNTPPEEEPPVDPNEPPDIGDDPTNGKDPANTDDPDAINQQEQKRLEELRLQQEQERLAAETLQGNS